MSRLVRWLRRLYRRWVNRPRPCVLCGAPLELPPPGTPVCDRCQPEWQMRSAW